MTRTEQTLPKSCLNLLITMDGSKIGLFGMLRLVKWMTDEQVAALPINEETIAFERDPTAAVFVCIAQRSMLCT
ncbi:uncharacterized protein BJ212DRAFT_599562 [Suillus subaureus]|uniref:Uncharacterized protein n=1 Tax=Suillus subaureus TaxID=48587 RepID=A0A9P7E3A4_9AGAM|nr:uncharacterized protein BJ212DRAFT_599562 [Suillus subaureus]KAG1809714.1 hypothetical protein BJ212DRAFT_599562 [Suillus subaureus]